MKREIEATYEENTIAPRLRSGEVMPPVPEGFVPTRLDGEIVFVSAPDPQDTYYGNSLYTDRQARELRGIREVRSEKELAVAEAAKIIYEARSYAITYG